MRGPRRKAGTASMPEIHVCFTTNEPKSYILQQGSAPCVRREACGTHPCVTHATPGRSAGAACALLDAGLLGTEVLLLGAMGVPNAVRALGLAGEEAGVRVLAPRGPVGACSSECRERKARSVFTACGKGGAASIVA
jgi:hypothetical protein